MGDDDELCAFIGAEIYFPQIGKLSLRRKRRFRFVEEIETIGAKIVFRKGKEAFAVGFFVVIMRYTAGAFALFFLFRSYVIKAFRAKEIAAFFSVCASR